MDQARFFNGSSPLNYILFPHIKILIPCVEQFQNKFLVPLLLVNGTHLGQSLQRIVFGARENMFVCIEQNQRSFFSVNCSGFQFPMIRIFEKICIACMHNSRSRDSWSKGCPTGCHWINFTASVGFCKKSNSFLYQEIQAAIRLCQKLPSSALSRSFFRQ